jgi:hypothetical protein
MNINPANLTFRQVNLTCKPNLPQVYNLTNLTFSPINLEIVILRVKGGIEGRVKGTKQGHLTLWERICKVIAEKVGLVRLVGFHSCTRLWRG